MPAHICLPLRILLLCATSLTLAACGQGAVHTLACAELAAHPDEPDLPGGVGGVTANALQPAAAIAACESALRADPGNARNRVRLARAYLASGERLRGEELLEQATAAGDVVAATLLGRHYLNESPQSPADLEQALYYLEIAAAAGHGQAQLLLAEHYRAFAGDTTAEPELAVAYLQRAADNGLARAQALLGWHYLRGEGVEQDAHLAARWLERSARRGDAGGQSLLGDLYFHGDGVARNDQRAMGWYRLAADQGDAWAMYRLGHGYAEGLGLARDDQAARGYLRRAAEAGLPQAQRELATRLVAEGNIAAAREYFRRAGEQGDADALFSLYQLAEDPSSDGALTWLTKAAEAAHLEARQTLAQWVAGPPGGEADPGQTLSEGGFRSVKASQHAAPADAALADAALYAQVIDDSPCDRVEAMEIARLAQAAPVALDEVAGDAELVAVRYTCYQAAERHQVTVLMTTAERLPNHRAAPRCAAPRLSPGSPRRACEPASRSFSGRAA